MFSDPQFWVFIAFIIFIGVMIKPVRRILSINLGNKIKEIAKSFDSIVKQYDSVIENLRLIKRPGINRWPKQDKRWSEIAIGQDINNNIIVIYCSSMLSMFELNEILLSLPIELQAAQHLEGNSLAQLYLKMNQYEINHDHNLYVPNLIGVRSKSEN